MHIVVFEPKTHVDPYLDAIPYIGTMAASNLPSKVIAPPTFVTTRFGSSDVATSILALALASPLDTSLASTVLGVTSSPLTYSPCASNVCFVINHYFAFLIVHLSLL